MARAHFALVQRKHDKALDGLVEERVVLVTHVGKENVRRLAAEFQRDEFIHAVEVPAIVRRILKMPDEVNVYLDCWTLSTKPLIEAISSSERTPFQVGMPLSGRPSCTVVENTSSICPA